MSFMDGPVVVFDFLFRNQMFVKTTNFTCGVENTYYFQRTVKEWILHFNLHKSCTLLCVQLLCVILCSTIEKKNSEKLVFNKKLNKE